MSPVDSPFLAAAHVLFEPGQVVEVRVPKAGKLRTISGYFDDFEKMAMALAQLEVSRYAGVYWTLNSVNRALLSRAENKVKPFADVTTSDVDILHRRWLPVDLDPKRPAGISSNEAGHAAALQLAQHVSTALSELTWPDPVFADSGNGAHLLYRVDLPNDPSSDDLLKRVLLGLGQRFNANGVEVDRTTFNAARIFKTYGTTARKGDNTADRPHRLSQILTVPALLTAVSVEQLQRIAAPDASPAVSHASPASSGLRRQFTIPDFLSRHNLAYRSPVAHEGGLKYVLEVCPFDSSHKAPDAAVFERADGQLAFKCFHNSCADRGWKEVRALFEAPRQYSRPWVVPPPPDFGPPEDPAPPVEEPAAPIDVDAAIAQAIATDDLLAAVSLAPAIAKLRSVDQLHITTRLRMHFKKEFPAAEFARALREERTPVGREPPEEPAAAAADGADGGEPDLLSQPLTDSGNGERIAAMFGEDSRWCIERKKWLVWDGKRWAEDDSQVMMQRAKAMCRELYKLAPRSINPPAYDKHARVSESHAGITQMLKCAAGEPGMPISARDLDQHPYLLNCLNGIVDLRDKAMTLYPHNKEYLITRLVHFAFDAKAQAPVLMRFLERAMGGVDGKGGSNPEADLPLKTSRLLSLLQRVFGYALTGDVREKKLFVLWGAEGNNGRTTLLEAFSNLISEYAAVIKVESFLESKIKTNDEVDLSDTVGARFAVTSEPNRNARFDEGRVKALTGGKSKHKTKRLYENPITAPITSKFFVECNDRPQINGTDKSIWRRLYPIPFEVSIEETDPLFDPLLSEKIAAEAQGMLAWAVRGAVFWFEKGLGDAVDVTEASDSWKQESDPLKEFIEDCCRLAEANAKPESENYPWCQTEEMTAAYRWWCAKNHEHKPLGRKWFAAQMRARAVKESRSRRARCGKSGCMICEANKNGHQLRTWEGILVTPEVLNEARESHLSLKGSLFGRE